MEEREAFFCAIRKRLAATPALRALMRKALNELGCPEYGACIGVSAEAELRVSAAELAQTIAQLRTLELE